MSSFLDINLFAHIFTYEHTIIACLAFVLITFTFTALTSYFSSFSSIKYLAFSSTRKAWFKRFLKALRTMLFPSESYLLFYSINRLFQRNGCIHINVLSSFCFLKFFTAFEKWVICVKIFPILLKRCFMSLLRWMLKRIMLLFFRLLLSLLFSVATFLQN